MDTKSFFLVEYFKSGQKPKLLMCDCDSTVVIVLKKLPQVNSAPHLLITGQQWLCTYTTHICTLLMKTKAEKESRLILCCCPEPFPILSLWFQEYAFTVLILKSKLKKKKIHTFNHFKKRSRPFFSKKKSCWSPLIVTFYVSPFVTLFCLLFPSLWLL